MGLSPNSHPSKQQAPEWWHLAKEHCLLPSLLPSLAYTENFSRSSTGKSDPVWLPAPPKKER